MGGPEVFLNDEKTRTFLALAAGGIPRGGGTSSSDSDSGGGSAGAGAHGRRQQRYCPQLVALSHAVSGVFAAHGLPRFYADPRPHVSGECVCCGGSWLPASAAKPALLLVLPPGRRSDRLQLPSHLCLQDPSLLAPRSPACPAVAWLLGEQGGQLEAALASPEVQAAAQRLAAHTWRLRPAAVVCKAGQREHVVWQAAEVGGGEPALP